MGLLEIKNMRFYAYHGCQDFESQVGNVFYVTVKFEYPADKIEQTDNLTEGINYVDIYNIVAKEMKIPSKMIENITYRIKQSIKVNFPQIETLSVSIYKQSPPANADIEAVIYTS